MIALFVTLTISLLSESVATTVVTTEAELKTALAQPSVSVIDIQDDIQVSASPEETPVAGQGIIIEPGREVTLYSSNGKAFIGNGKRILRNEGTLTMQDLTLKGGGGGNNGWGGCARNLGTMVLKNVLMEDCNVGGNNGQGGCIYNTGTLTAHHTILKNCRIPTYGRGGGIYNSDAGVLTLSNFQFIDNFASNVFGAAKGICLWTGAPYTFVNVLFKGNYQRTTQGAWTPDYEVEEVKFEGTGTNTVSCPLSGAFNTLEAGLLNCSSVEANPLLSPPGAGASTASVGGDPVTKYQGKEYKFELPEGQLTPLLHTKDLIVHASAFAGESAGEQWIDRFMVQSADGEEVVDVRIRKDIIGFKRDKEVPGLFETLLVRAPWVGEGMLGFPSDDKLIHWGKLMFQGQPFMHPKNITFDLFRIQNPSAISFPTPRREGLVITCDSVKLVITSTSALEYYWEDPNDFHAVKFAHLDMDVIDMKDPSTFRGLLPEVWGLIPAATGTKSSTDFVVKASGDQRSEQDANLRKLILSNLLSDHGEAKACGGSQCK